MGRMHHCRMVFRQGHHSRRATTLTKQMVADSVQDMTTSVALHMSVALCGPQAAVLKLLAYATAACSTCVCAELLCSKWGNLVLKRRQRFRTCALMMIASSCVSQYDGQEGLLIACRLHASSKPGRNRQCRRLKPASLQSLLYAPNMRPLDRTMTTAVYCKPCIFALHRVHVAPSDASPTASARLKGASKARHQRRRRQCWRCWRHSLMTLCPLQRLLAL